MITYNNSNTLFLYVIYKNINHKKLLLNIYFLYCSSSVENKKFSVSLIQFPTCTNKGNILKILIYQYLRVHINTRKTGASKLQNCL